MLSDEKIKAEIKEEIKKAEIKKAEIKEVVKKVNDLFRERNYFKTIMDGYSHVSEEEVDSEHDGGQKYEDGTVFFYPLIDEYEKDTIYKKDTIYGNLNQPKCPIPSPDDGCNDEYQDFLSLIDYKKKESSELFFKPTYKKYQIYFTNSEGKLLRLSGDRLFHFPQLMPNVDDCKREDAFSLLKKELKKDDSLLPLINTFTKASALPGGYIFWRVTDEGEGSGVNSARGGQWPAACDRFDLALEALREWFTDGTDGYDAKAYKEKGYTLLAAFSEDKKAGYPLFSEKNKSGWKDFVNFFELKGSFVDDDYRVYNQVASDPFKEEMGVAFDPDEWKTCTLRKSWSDPKHDEGIPPEIENYLINSIKTIIKRTERLNEVLHRA